MSIDAVFASPWGALLIFALRIVDVSCDTMRVIFTIRGRRLVAALLGFLQALVWIFAVGNAVRHLDSWLHILGYSAGYGMGTFVGITIEQALAFGVVMVHVFSRTKGGEIAAALRQKGHGVTAFIGHGREGQVDVLMSVTQRGHLPELMDVVEEHDPSAFVTVEEPKSLRRGSIMEREWLPWKSQPTRIEALAGTRGRDLPDE